MKKVISFFCLIACTLIWGTTFIAQDTGMDNIGPFTFNSVRFFVGFLTVLPFVFLFEKKKIKHQIKNNRNQFIKLILPVGIFLFLGCIFQQVSLLYTDVANSAFFTIFYVPLVPIIVYFLFSEKPHWSIWPSVLACITGGYFLSDFNNSEVRLGDALVLIGALFWALHIIYIGKIIERFDVPFFIALMQNLIVAILSFLLVMLFEEINFSKIKLETIEILYAGILSGGAAFALQLFGQRNISAAPAAIVMSLEGAIAAISAWIILNQILGISNIIGCILILFGVLFSQLLPIYESKTNNI
ncbi:MAG TPA: DMT family transporter [Candidatus Pelagibacter bacterium]|jgi:drug/metabolite transporter (DMT)-like permease|nr:EamA family transporter [Candidatus Pelagibacter sp.]MBO41458.1 EamA family transporter [Pelagibacteraceae bacterium]HJN84682.1 DMT family transporter [Candidatus Pelagibacter bacterium]|tara:strand:- start:158 stop:1057 length:900 start_codon:yes stop_codon:yes gene_type:complete